MAAGNKVVGMATISTNGGTYDIQPPSGQEWTVMNIKISGSSGQYTLSDYNGTTLNTYETASSPNAYLGLSENLTNAQWIRVTSTTTNAITISYNGVQTT